jgi:hypothetical protein
MAETLPRARATQQGVLPRTVTINGCTDTPTYPATPTIVVYNCAYYRRCQGGLQVGICINNYQHAYASAVGG